MKKSSAFLMVILLLAVSVLAACGGAKTSDTKTAAGGEQKSSSSGDGSLDRVKKAGKLLVGIDASYPPMEFVDKDGKTPIGFDVDFGKALAKKLGVEYEAQIVDWNGIQAGLLGKHYDVIISSMTITEERQKDLNFVEYVKMGISYVSRDGVNVKEAKDLSGKIVAVQAETTAHIMIDDMIKQGTVKDIKDLKSFTYATDAFQELKNGRADVVAIDEPVARYYAKQDANVVKITGVAAPPDPIGIALRKEDGDLKKAIEQAVADLNSDGTYKKLSDQWFGGELGK